MIKINNLKKKYHGKIVVDISNLSVNEGEIYGFLGINGAGKTTTMKLILSLIKADEGHISVLGKNINHDKKYLEYIGSIIEEPSYYPNLTAYENLLVLQKLVGFSVHNIEETLKLVGLSDSSLKKKLVKNYSLGMKQRLSLAFALVKKPKILILDEPTNGLDPAGIHEIRQLLIKLAKERGLAILISTHILSEIENIADKVGIIHCGKLVYENTMKDIHLNKWIDIRGDFSNNHNLLNLIETMDVNVLNLTQNHLQVNNIADIELSLLIRQLIVNNYDLTEVVKKQESLENIFLKLIER